MSSRRMGGGRWTTGTWGGLGGLWVNDNRAPLVCSDLLGVKVWLGTPHTPEAR